ncbi:unnamed protein product [Callosobruchus maculatus]|uniref:Uncharacterized protein n=1 Tax=Callosobruchus maculatus TaxID=64391 RepID=A0A653DPL8_CALMS|nr:unnamed protein product [Callosobruchus maculatus]
MTVTTTLTTHSLTVSQKMEIHRLMNKFHRLKGKKADSPKRILPS